MAKTIASMQASSRFHRCVSELFSLLPSLENHSSKEVIIFHQELSGVGRRFEHQLTADAHHLADATSVGSKIICCYTLGKHLGSLLQRYHENSQWNL